MNQYKPKIWLSSPHMGSKEQQYVQEAFDTNWIAPVGPHLDKFEISLSKFANNQQIGALSSGTAALHLALILAGVGPGDYVICQSLTFAASANPILYQGAIPIFVDSEVETWNMAPEYLIKAIEDCLKGEFKSAESQKIKGKSQLPKAIIPVHLYGMPAKIKEIIEIADKYGIPVIEDAAEALGSKIKDQFCGSFGDFGVFSFNGNKIITTSGGGAITGKNSELIERAKFLAAQAKEKASHYEHEVIGYNYRLSNVSAAIGIGQVEVLPERILARRRNFEFYKKELKSVEGVSFLEEPEGYFSNRWLTTVLIDNKLGINKDMVRLSLEKENIESRPVWKPMHLQPVYKGYPYVGKQVSQKIFESGLCLPSGSNLSEEDKLSVVRTFMQVWEMV